MPAAIDYWVLQKNCKNLYSLNDIGVKSNMFWYVKSEFGTIDLLTSFLVHFWRKCLLPNITIFVHNAVCISGIFICINKCFMIDCTVIANKFAIFVLGIS